MPNITRNNFKIFIFSFIINQYYLFLFSEQKLNSAELLQAQQPLVQYTVKICLNVSCHSPLLFYNTIEVIQWLLQSSLNLIEWLTQYFVFIYTPNTADKDHFTRIYVVTGSYVPRDRRFYFEIFILWTQYESLLWVQ